MKAERKPLHDGVLGVLIAMSAAYGYGLMTLLLGWSKAPGRVELGTALVLPLLGVVAVSWYVVPLGAAIGVALPRLVHMRDLPAAALISVLVCLAIPAALSLGLFVVSWGDLTDVRAGLATFPLLFFYCLPWVLAFGLNRRIRGVA